MPNTGQPLFDPLSHALLQPDTDIRPQIVDDTWLIQKHRDTLQDFVDVFPDEKEYMREWDGFVFKKRISSAAYLSREFLAFVRERGPWLVAKQSRMLEFGKHLSVLMARGVLEDTVIADALIWMNGVRIVQKVPAEEEPRLSPKEAQFRSVKGCAICGLPILGPSLLVCSNQVRSLATLFLLGPSLLSCW